MADRENYQWLRRSFTPYVGPLVIFALFTVFVCYGSLTRDQKDMLMVPALILVLYTPIVYFNLRYKVGYSSESIVQEASGGPPTRFSYSAIHLVKLERGSVARGDAGRPYRRIALYAKTNGAVRHIDVSVRHFRATDIRVLFDTLRKVRPDLVVPSFDGYVWSPA
jgi:hypothetical protein